MSEPTIAPAAVPPVPSPADIAARAGQQQPAPVTPPAPAPGSDEAMVTVTQRRLNVIMRDEKDEGRRSAYRAVAEAVGLDPETFDPSKFGDIFKQAEQARQQQLSEEQRRAEELQRQTQALQADKTKLEQQQAEIAEARRTLAREQALIRLGAVDATDEQGAVTAPNLQDALAMLERDLRENPDADAAALTAAAEALKKRRPELFGTTAQQTLPPAPSGGPASGNAPRPAVNSKDAVKEAARRRAEAMNLRRPDAA